MGNAMLCGSGDDQEATWMVTDMVNGGNALLCNDHLPAWCYDVLVQSGLIGNDQEPPADAVAVQVTGDGDGEPKPADAAPVEPPATPEEIPVPPVPQKPRRRSSGN